MDRKKFIGSSDIAGVLGMSRWSSPLSVWAEKTGMIAEKDLSDNEAVEWGKRLEKVISEKFAEKHKCKLMAYKKRFSHKDYPYMTCELDNIIVGTDTIVEIKTANEFKYKEWTDGETIPQEYLLQVQYAMGLSGRKDCWLAVLVGGNKYMEKFVEFDSELFETMVEKVKTFWEEFVLTKVEPIATGFDLELLKDLHPNVTEEMIEGNNDINEAIALRQETSMHINEMIREKEAVEAKIKQFIGKNEGVITDEYVCTWKKQYRKEYVVPASETRVIRVKKLKKGD